VRGKHGNDALGAAIRGALDLVRGAFADKKVVIFLIFILNKRVISCPNTLCLYIFID
jgi:hypothetical protein